MAAQQGSRKKSATRLRVYPFYFSSIFFVTCGLALIFLASLNSLTATWSNSRKSVNPAAGGETKSEANPVQLYIPKLAKVLYISDGEVVDNRWTISATGVSYLTSSALPGDGGNSVLYGHNRADILGGLPALRKGDVIYVAMSDGQSIKYTVFETREIKPTQVEILKGTEDARLTIYTCSGFLDQARFVVVARYIEG